MPPTVNTSRVIRNTLFRLVSITSAHNSSEIPAVTPPPLRPALFTSVSTAPNRSTAPATNARTSAPDRTSHALPSTSSPSSRRLLTVVVTESSVRAQK